LALGEGAGTFSEPMSLAGDAAGVIGLLVGDLNQDGLSDIAGANANDNQLAVLLGQGKGSFTSTLYPMPGYVDAVALLPKPNAAPDLLLTASNSSIPDSGSVRVLRNSGQGIFSIGPIYTAPGGLLSVGDFNGDCILDIANTGVYAGLSVLYGDQDGGFEPAQELSYPGACPHGLAALGPVGHPSALAVGDSCGGGVTVYGDASKP
jgi:hypothetical protein